MSVELAEKVEATLGAYSQGAFPMAENGELGYFECDPRSVLLYESFHVSKRLKRLWRQQPFTFKIDGNFSAVVRSCREGRPEWISLELIEIYEVLHQQGFMHSFEAYEGDELVGGCYGMAMGAAFMAESMFHRKTHASNLCVVYMMECLHKSGFDFCDIQYANEHTLKFCPEAWSASTFRQHLMQAVLKPVKLESL